MKLLIIEDEFSLKQSMVDFLTASSYLCESASNYHDSIEKIELFDYDCIILDIMLPGGSGLDLLKSLKQNNKSDGVIIISAKGELDDKIQGIEMGADDYLAKPFHLSELAVRIAAIIRRKSFQGKSQLTFGNITIDVQGKRVTVENKELDLTQKEYQLLLYLSINKNRVLSKNAIAQHLWGDDMDFPDNYDFIYAHIKNLRKKLVSAGAEDCIRSIYGEGYKMQIE
ncbi:MAG: response regulator transcription factor [Bacteroidetes bacterium]|nr:response regulator transcription factor [Bacteroidota bacterium]